MIEAESAGDSAPRALFLGEGPNSARYLEGVLQTAYRVDRVHNSQPLTEAVGITEQLGEFSLYVLSDYSARNLGAAVQEAVVQRVESGGAGLLMIGGWASFSGPRAGWRGTRLAEMLPVECVGDDDRTNSPLGTVLIPRREAHPAIASTQKAEPCVVVGYNAVRARPEAEVLINGYALGITREPSAPHYTLASAIGPARLGARRLITHPLRSSLEHVPTPMLTVWSWGSGRVGAFAPDVSPHWSGGIVDWGQRRVRLPTGSEVGHLYGAFLLDLCGWLAEGAKAPA